MGKIEMKEFLPSKGSLVTHNVTKEYNERVILKDISLAVNSGDRIGLVGSNGCGKSTLLKVMAGLERADAGSVEAVGLKVGYLPQTHDFDLSQTIEDVVLEGVSELVAALAEFESMSANYQAGDDVFETHFSETLELIEDNDGFNLNERVKRIVRGLNIDYELTTPVGNLSGGELMKVVLARLLLTEPDILLLDEPTNHLDLAANFWLRKFIREWPGGLLVVSHDRDFLNDVTDTTWELEAGEMSAYGGDYSFYEEQKRLEQEARERELKLAKKGAKKALIQAEKEDERAAHNARRRRGGRSALDDDHCVLGYFAEQADQTAGALAKKKKQARETAQEGLEQALKAAKEQPKIRPQIERGESHTGKMLVTAKAASFGYVGVDEPILEEVDLMLSAGDRVAVFGNNGSGKTTLVKGLLGGEVERTGEIEAAENLKYQVLDQNYSLVDREKTVLENMRDYVDKEKSESWIRQQLARYLFRTTQEVSRRASVLSGGELVRLSLAMVTAGATDLLVLDEPTNNLDLDSIAEIELVLNSYQGAVLVISHDLAFLENIGVDQSYVVRNKRLERMKRNPNEGDEFTKELLAALDFEHDV